MPADRTDEKQPAPPFHMIGNERIGRAPASSDGHEGLRLWVTRYPTGATATGWSEWRPLEPHLVESQRKVGWEVVEVMPTVEHEIELEKCEEAGMAVTEDLEVERRRTEDARSEIDDFFATVDASRGGDPHPFDEPELCAEAALKVLRKARASLDAGEPEPTSVASDDADANAELSDSTLLTLEAIWRESAKVVLNDDDAQDRHQRINTLAYNELVSRGVLTPGKPAPASVEGEPEHEHAGKSIWVSGSGVTYWASKPGFDQYRLVAAVDAVEEGGDGRPDPLGYEFKLFFGEQSWPGAGWVVPNGMPGEVNLIVPIEGKTPPLASPPWPGIDTPHVAVTFAVADLLAALRVPSFGLPDDVRRLALALVQGALADEALDDADLKALRRARAALRVDALPEREDGDRLDYKGQYEAVVEALRDYWHEQASMPLSEAARRLRDTLVESEKEVKRQNGWAHSFEKERDEARAEIERLTGEVAKEKERGDRNMATANRLVKERNEARAAVPLSTDVLRKPPVELCRAITRAVAIPAVDAEKVSVTIADHLESQSPPSPHEPLYRRLFAPFATSDGSDDVLRAEAQGAVRKWLGPDIDIYGCPPSPAGDANTSEGVAGTSGAASDVANGSPPVAPSGDPFRYGGAVPLLKYIRGMCSDELPHVEIDAKISEPIDRLYAATPPSPAVGLTAVEALARMRVALCDNARDLSRMTQRDRRRLGEIAVTTLLPHLHSPAVSEVTDTEEGDDATR